MNHNYDIIIVGGGPAGLFAAWEIARTTKLSVCLLERGLAVHKRKCYITETTPCAKCKPCHILSGMGGGGLFSDGKLNFIPKLGKTDLTQFMSLREAQKLIDDTEEAFTLFGMDGEVYPSDMSAARAIRQEARRRGVDLLLIRQKHLGSDCLPAHIGNMTQWLVEHGVHIKTGENVLDVVAENQQLKGIATSKGQYGCKAAILAPGRVGADFVLKLATRHGMGLVQRGIEVGVRVETHNDVMSAITDVVYDPTFFVQTTKHDDQTRTFCTNPGGFISLENYQDFVCVNGHSMQHTKSENTNFAFLSKVVLTDPVSDNQGYGMAIGRLAHLIGGGKPLLQRLGDFRRGRRSSWQRIQNGYIEPTFKDATPGDIAMALPGRVTTNLVEGLERLSQVIPGIADDATLLYAPEIKFFATQIETSREMESAVANLFFAGDGPGLAGNIVSAAATGIIAARACGKRHG